MEQRQLRLGDILDDYCPRERRVTNHAVVAMVGPDVKQTRCTTCDAEHGFKHARVPRQRRKPETPAALYAQVAAGAPKRVAHDPVAGDGQKQPLAEAPTVQPAILADSANRELVATGGSGDGVAAPIDAGDSRFVDERAEDDANERAEEEGPVHRPLIRASLPRPEGQPPPTRPLPEFTIRQPGGRQNRFRPRHQRGGQGFQGNRSPGNTGGGPMRGGMPRQGGSRPPHGAAPPSLARRHGPGRKRSK